MPQPDLCLSQCCIVGDDTALGGIRRLVSEAQTSSSRAQALADRAAALLFYVAVGAAVVTATTWLAIGEPGDAVVRTITVLIIACPCGMGLATPTAIMVGSARGAEQGVLFKSAEVFERAKAIDTVVFDKTGTLTRGAMTLSTIETDEPVDHFLTLVGSVEAASEHPIGMAVALGAEERELTLQPVEDFAAHRGLGVEGGVDGVRVAVGRPQFMNELEFDISEQAAAAMERIERQGHTAFLAAWDRRVRGALGVADTVRASARSAVSDLRSLDVDVAMLTGDNTRTAEEIASEVGISRVIAGVLPAGKADEVSRLQASGRSVAFVGDGINDAPALTRADLGMAVGSGTDVAIEAGDVVLMSGDPQLAITALGLARATFRTIKQNLFWAFAYNTAAIPLAALGLLNPMIAAAAMAFSSVSVVTNSLRLRRFGRT